MPTPLEHCNNATSIGQYLTEAAERYADSNAFSCGSMQLSYASFAKQGKSFAAYLQSVGIAKGNRVALMTPNLPAFPIATLGILTAGAIQVNVNPMYTQTELEHQLNDAGVDTIIVFGGATAALGAVKDKSPVKRIIVIHAGDGTDVDIPPADVDSSINDYVLFSDALLIGEGIKFKDVDIARNDLAFLQYTGGTTGLSKGAMLSHGNVLTNIAQVLEMAPDGTRENHEVVVTAIPMYHIFALTVNFLVFAAVGAHNVLITNPRDMSSFVESIRNSGFTVITGVNTLFAGLTSHPEFKDCDFSNLVWCVNGGTAALEATSDKWESITGLPLVQGYGLSETSPVLTLMLPSVRTFTGQIGQAVPNTSIKLLDDSDNVVAIGERGELVAKGPQVMAGYYNNPEATANAFTSDGYFRTGDIATVDKYGNYEIVDRKKDMVIVSGFNVYPNEVEQVAAKCEGVAECACLGTTDDKTGEAVKLFAVLSKGSVVTEADIISHCREHLAAYKVPKTVAFIDEIPKSAVGKMLRRLLRDV